MSEREKGIHRMRGERERKYVTGILERKRLLERNRIKKERERKREIGWEKRKE
jgi:hypothetical protein